MHFVTARGLRVGIHAYRYPIYEHHGRLAEAAGRLTPWRRG